MVVVTSALLLSPVLTAAAPASQTIFEGRLQNQDLKAHFDVDRKLGRAWVDVELTSNSLSDVSSEVIPRGLEGLYYDQARGQVIYRNGATGIVCAEDSSFLGLRSLKDTGQCQLRVSSETRRVDDGFDGQQEMVGKVTFEATPNRLE